MISAKSQFQKVTYYMIPHPSNDKIKDMENRLVVTRGQIYWGSGGMMIKRQHEEDLCGNGIVLYLECSGGYINLHR